MSRYTAKDSVIQDRQLEVNTLVIPFQVVGNATPANVVLRNDEPGRMALQSAGVNQITAALLADETATYTDGAPSDASGELNCLVRINEPVGKVLGASVTNLDADGFVLASAGANLGSATGITTGTAGGTALMVSMVTGSAHTSGTHNLALVVHYVVAE